MATDPSWSALVADVHDHSRTVIEAELHRLARRVPSLHPVDLEVIDATLEEVCESLLLARLRDAPPATVPLLRHIFDIRELDTPRP